MATATKPATCRAEIVRIKCWRLIRWPRAAQAAIVIQALGLVIAGCSAFGHSVAATAVGGVWDGLELVHYSLAPL